MGYLADIVADARDRRGTGLVEEAVELTVPGESGTANSGKEAGNAVVRSPVSPEHAAAIEVSERTRNPDNAQPGRGHITAAKPAKSPAETDGPATTQPSLHEHLLRLSQQTLMERSERILMQQQKPGARPTAVADAAPTPASTPDAGSQGSSRHAPPGAESASNQAMEVSSEARAQPAVEHLSTHHRSVSHTEIRESRQQDTAMPRDVRKPLQQQVAGPAAHRSVPERPLPPVASTAAPQAHAATAPPRQSAQPASPAPQLRIEQINVVVESTRPDKERQCGLERDPDPGSRYFLRSL